MGIVMLVVGLIGSLVGVIIFGRLGLMMWHLGLRKHDFSAFMLTVGFWFFALIIGSVGVSIVAAHFDLMQIGRSAFDVATYSALRVCLVLANVFFWVGLLASAFQPPPASKQFCVREQDFRITGFKDKYGAI